MFAFQAAHRKRGEKRHHQAMITFSSADCTPVLITTSVAVDSAEDMPHHRPGFVDGSASDSPPQAGLAQR